MVGDAAARIVCVGMANPIMRDRNSITGINNFTKNVDDFVFIFQFPPKDSFTTLTKWGASEQGPYSAPSMAQLLMNSLFLILD